MSEKIKTDINKYQKEGTETLVQNSIEQLHG